MTFAPVRRSVLFLVPAGLVAATATLAFAVGSAGASPATSTAAPAAGTAAPATVATTTAAPTTVQPTTAEPTTAKPTTSASSAASAPSTAGPTSSRPTAAAPKGQHAGVVAAPATSTTPTTATAPTTATTATTPSAPTPAVPPTKAPAVTAASLTTTSVLQTVNGKAATSSTPIKGGDVLVYGVSVTNTGTATATFTLTEYVPTHTTYAATKTVWRGCSKGSAAGTVCTQAVSLPAGDKGTSTFTVQVENPLPGGARSIKGDLAVSAGTCAACAPTNPTVADLHTSIAVVSVNGAKATATTPVAAGDVVVYAVTVSNNGGSTGTTTVHVGTLTKAITVASDATQTQDYTVKLAAYPSDTKTLTATVTTTSGACSACTATNPTVAHLSTVKTIYRVAGTVVGSSVTLRSGDLVVYHVTVTNTGGSTGSTTLSDTVPANTSYVGKTQGWSCPRHSAAGTACIEKATVAAGAALEVHYTLLIGSSSGAAFSSITNTVTSSVGSCAVCTVTTPAAQESTTGTGSTLPNTGVNATDQGVIGVGLLAAGLVLSFAGRRRRTA